MQLYSSYAFAIPQMYLECLVGPRTPSRTPIRPIGPRLYLYPDLSRVGTPCLRPKLGFFLVPGWPGFQGTAPFPQLSVMAQKKTTSITFQEPLESVQVSCRDDRFTDQFVMAPHVEAPDLHAWNTREIEELSGNLLQWSTVVESHAKKHNTKKHIPPASSQGLSGVVLQKCPSSTAVVPHPGLENLLLGSTSSTPGYFRTCYGMISSGKPKATEHMSLTQHVSPRSLDIPVGDRSVDPGHLMGRLA